MFNKKQINKLKSIALLSSILLPVLSLILLPTQASAQNCVSPAGVVSSNIQEGDCPSTGGTWVNKAERGKINCISGSTVLPNVGFGECDSMGGTALQAPPTIPPAADTQSAAASAQNNNLADTAGGGKASTQSKYFKASTDSIGEYINAIYVYAIGIIGIIATIVIMGAGLIWISSMGNASRVSDAKEWIAAALTGLALAMFSYTILWIINPDLVNLQALNPTSPSSQGPSSTGNPKDAIGCNITCDASDGQVCQAEPTGGYRCVKSINNNTKTTTIEECNKITDEFQKAVCIENLQK